MESYNPIIEMAGAGKKPKKIEKLEELEKTQEELKELFVHRLDSLTTSAVAKLEDYETKLEDGSFDGEEGERRKKAMQESITGIIDRVETMKGILDSGEEIPEIMSEIMEVNYTYTNPTTKKVEKQETITIDIEKKIKEFINFYETKNIDLPTDFESRVRDIWERNGSEIQKTIEEKGFDDILIVPTVTDIVELSKKMKMDNGYFDYINSVGSVEDLSGIPLVSVAIDTTRVVLVHKAQNLLDHPELVQTRGKKAQDLSVDESLSFEDYLIFQNKYNIETGKYLDESGWTWLLKTKSGTRFVGSGWGPSGGELIVDASAAAHSDPDLGCRLSRYFT